MEKLTVGILAHVDAGKTTLSEALLYRSGVLRKLGRVDHQNAFLDTETLERERGITIFSKQALLPIGQLEITLLDTPGHVDFSAEMERTLQVLDYAILVISGTDGVQSHTRTLWHLLERYHIPTFVFFNKMDLLAADQNALLAAVKQALNSGCVDFSASPANFYEEAAMCDETALETFLSTGAIPDEQLASLIAQRRLFPCFFGSALKLQQVDEFLRALERYTLRPRYPDAFGARVFKIGRDPQGARLTYLKVTGGSLKVKTVVSNRRPSMPQSEIWEEKINEIRIYSGAKYKTAEEVTAGTVCAVTGLGRTYAGEGLGAQSEQTSALLEPVLSYRLNLPPGCDAHAALLLLRQLEEEDPQLHITWSEHLHCIQVQLMGEVQLEILQRLILERFGLQVTFEAPQIIYRETIAAPVEGVGHFEPLRHYAEVHLLLEPLPRGSGLQFETFCSEEQLERSWQRLVLTHLAERVHPGVLTGSAITDMRISLIAGRAHQKHTEGGDFRQATYRAVRQGLMHAQNILLEPWYNFRLELPTDCIGRAMADLQRMCARVDAPESSGGMAVLTGSAPVLQMRGYALEVTSFTRGMGRLFCSLRGFEPCHNQEEAVAAIGYDAQRDMQNPADSVFCSHGAGYVVKWDEVFAHMHVPSPLKESPQQQLPPQPSAGKPAGAKSSFEQDEELRRIFERTYGPIRQRAILPRQYTERTPSFGKESVPFAGNEPEYLLVDGYNIIFAWEDLRAVARDNLDAARKLLMDLLCNYQGVRQCTVILVFDAYKVPHGAGEASAYHNIHIVYTKEAETADAYIERVSYVLSKKYRVRVATSDGPEQLIILGHGALRLSAEAFRLEVEAVQKQIAEILEKNNRTGGMRTMEEAFARAGENAGTQKDKPPAQLDPYKPK